MVSDPSETTGARWNEKERTQPPVPSPRTEYTSQLSLPPLRSSQATMLPRSREPMIDTSRTISGLTKVRPK